MIGHRIRLVAQLGLTLSLVFLSAVAVAQGIPDQRNTNIIGSLPPQGGIPEANKQQNEASCSKKPSNPLHVLCAFNDYRGVDNPLIEARLHEVQQDSMIYFHENHILAVHPINRQDLVSQMSVEEMLAAARGEKAAPAAKAKPQAEKKPAAKASPRTTAS